MPKKRSISNLAKGKLLFIKAGLLLFVIVWFFASSMDFFKPDNPTAKELINDRPLSPQSWLQASSYYFENNQLGLANEAIQTARSLAQKSAFYLNEVLIQQLRYGKFIDALVTAKQLLEVDERRVYEVYELLSPYVSTDKFVRDILPFESADSALGRSDYIKILFRDIKLSGDTGDIVKAWFSLKGETKKRYLDDNAYDLYQQLRQAKKYADLAKISLDSQQGFTVRNSDGPKQKVSRLRGPFCWLSNSNGINKESVSQIHFIDEHRLLLEKIEFNKDQLRAMNGSNKIISCHIPVQANEQSRAVTFNADVVLKAEQVINKTIFGSIHVRAYSDDELISQMKSSLQNVSSNSSTDHGETINRLDIDETARLIGIDITVSNIDQLEYLLIDDFLLQVSL